MRKKLILTITILLAVSCLLTSANAGVLYNVTDLGVGTAWSLNNNGQVVGTSSGSATLFDTAGGGNNITLGGEAAFSINDNGQIVGYGKFGNPFVHHAMLFDPTGQGNNIDLTPSAAYSSYARAINNYGQIVGEESYGATVFDLTGNGNNLSLGAGSAHSINDFGQIVGHGGSQAILFDSTGQSQNNIYLGTLGGDLSYARSINNVGQIVGFARAIVGKSQQQNRATLFDPTGGGNNIDLGTSGFTQSDALSINSHGQIVGILGSEEKAAIFDPTGNGNNIILDTLIDPTLGWDLRVANSINDYGQIVGYGTIDGETHAFLLTPIPEPTTLLLLGMGGLLIRKRKYPVETTVSKISLDSRQGEWV